MTPPEDKPVHPVDALKDLSARMGFPPMSAEGEAAARKVCDELVPAVTVPVSLTEGMGRIDGVVTDRGAERLDKRKRGTLTIRG